MVDKLPLDPLAAQTFASAALLLAPPGKKEWANYVLKQPITTLGHLRKFDEVVHGPTAERKILNLTLALAKQLPEGRFTHARINHKNFLKTYPKSPLFLEGFSVNVPQEFGGLTRMKTAAQQEDPATQTPKWPQKNAPTGTLKIAGAPSITTTSGGIYQTVTTRFNDHKNPYPFSNAVVTAAAGIVDGGRFIQEFAHESEQLTTPREGALSRLKQNMINSITSCAASVRNKKEFTTNARFTKDNDVEGGATADALTPEQVMARDREVVPILAKITIDYMKAELDDNKERETKEKLTYSAMARNVCAKVLELKSVGDSRVVDQLVKYAITRQTARQPPIVVKSNDAPCTAHLIAAAATAGAPMVVLGESNTKSTDVYILTHASPLTTNYRSPVEEGDELVFFEEGKKNPWTKTQKNGAAAGATAAGATAAGATAAGAGTNPRWKTTSNSRAARAARAAAGATATAAGAATAGATAAGAATAGATAGTKNPRKTTRKNGAAPREAGAAAGAAGKTLSGYKRPYPGTRRRSTAV